MRDIDYRQLADTIWCIIKDDWNVANTAILLIWWFPFGKRWYFLVIVWTDKFKWFFFKRNRWRKTKITKHRWEWDISVASVGMCHWYQPLHPALNPQSANVSKRNKISLNLKKTLCAIFVQFKCINIYALRIFTL